MSALFSNWTKVSFRFTVLLLFSAVAAPLLLLGCGSDGVTDGVMFIGGVPDQKAANLNRRFGAVADYLSQELDVKVEYVRSVSYSALVTAFEKGDVHLAWFGGLTGVQARLMAPGAKAIAQRSRDAEFHSVFVVRSDLDADGLEDLNGLTFTFGSESSTSGHLMPRYFLTQAGLDPETGFRGKPSFSGSHDKTWKLVESGSFQAGALNEAVWQQAVEEGKVDLSEIRILYTTPAYYDYNWSVTGDLDEEFGTGFTGKVAAAFLGLDPQVPEEGELLDLFQTQSFIGTRNENYRAIEEVARGLGIIQ